jgi:FKBP-type peptidyl-prolyl cis-trans isomerase
MKIIHACYPLLLASLFLVSACNEPNDKTQVKPKRSDAENDKIIREQFVKANQQQTQKENDEMDFYAKSHKMPFIKTKSGIRYWVYKPSAKGDSIKEGMVITMNYLVKLLNGVECYSSLDNGPRTFEVGKEDIESGIHKGVQYVKRGDKVMFMIPSVLAHGLLGDFQKIPPQMPIIYDVEIH